MLKIRKRAILSALHGAKELHPNEFIALFKGEEKDGEWTLTELLITPFSEYEESSSSYSEFFIPTNTGGIASFHSHPTPNNSFPSRQDLRFFTQKRFNLIASYPYRVQDVNAFNSKGKKMEFEIV